MKTGKEHKSEDAYKIAYSDVFWVFTVTSVVGFILEGIWHTLRKGYWEDHTATIWGPFCLIYGFAAVVLYVLAYSMKTENGAILFGVSALAGTAAEFVTAELQEAFFGTYSWNYSHHAFNIGGKLSLQMTFIWGVLGLVFMRCVYPKLSTRLSELREGNWKVACVLFSAFMIADMLVTFIVVQRWTDRVRGTEPDNSVERYIDKKWDDSKMEKVFPNMKFIEER